MHQGVWVWIGFILLVGVLMTLNQKARHSGPVKQATAEFRRLAERVRRNESSDEDLTAWERSMSEMEKFPSEFNRLDQAEHVRKSFALYLERHYPESERWKPFMKAFHQEKDTVLGFKIQRREE